MHGFAFFRVPARRLPFVNFRLMSLAVLASSSIYPALCVTAAFPSGTFIGRRALCTDPLPKARYISTALASHAKFTASSTPCSLLEPSRDSSQT